MGFIWIMEKSIEITIFQNIFDPILYPMPCLHRDTLSDSCLLEHDHRKGSRGPAPKSHLQGLGALGAVGVEGVEGIRGL